MRSWSSGSGCIGTFPMQGKAHRNVLYVAETILFLHSHVVSDFIKPEANLEKRVGNAFDYDWWSWIYSVFIR